MGFRFKSRIQASKRGKIGFNQSLLHIHRFTTLSPHFYFLFNSKAEKMLGRKNVLGGICIPFPPTPPQVMTTSHIITCTLNFSVAFVPVCKSNSRESRTASRPQTLGKCKGNVWQNLRKSFVVSLYGS
jgi:hypothetical protein